MTTAAYSRDELVRQPIGYWSGEAHRRVAGAIRDSLAANGLSQPQWWILNRIDDAARAWTRAELVEELAPYSDREEGRDVGDELEQLVEPGRPPPTATRSAEPQPGRSASRRLVTATDGRTGTC